MADERDKKSSGNSRSLVPSYTLSYGGGAGQSWFGPLAPMNPVAPPSVKGRVFDFPTGYNQSIRPRAYEPVSFEQLRAFADGYDLLRLVIETRKDQLAKMNWTLAARDDVENPDTLDDRIKEIKKALRRPDRHHFWAEWLRMVLEDLFVLDAPAVHRRKTNGGDVYSFDPLDGATIKRIIDEQARTPEPPLAAYQQVLKGLPAVEYTTEELLYRPRNPRTHKVYGYSPVEQIIMTVNIALRRQVWQLQSFTEGNMPEALIGVPMTWTPDQIERFQDWFDQMLEGNTAQRRKAKFIPGDVAKGYMATKPAAIFEAETEEWLARVVCFCFSISPTPFVKQVNRATAATAQEAALSEGLAPIMGWVKSFMDTILIEDFGEDDIEFMWAEEEELDQNVQSQIIDREVKNGTATINDGRRAKGLDPYPEPDADRPMQWTATAGYAPLFLTPEEKAAKDALAAAAIAAPPGGAAGGDDASPGQDDGKEPGKTPAKEPDPKPGVAKKGATPFPFAPMGHGPCVKCDEDKDGDALSKGEWNEEDHPRAENGQFDSGGFSTQDSMGMTDAQKQDLLATLPQDGSDRTMEATAHIEQAFREKESTPLSQQRNSRLYLATDDKGNLVGAMHVDFSGNDGRITHVGSLSSGAGRELLDMATHEAGTRGKDSLTLEADAHGAQGYWEKNGFSVVHEESGSTEMQKPVRKLAKAIPKSYVDPDRKEAKAHQKKVATSLHSALSALGSSIAEQVKRAWKGLGKADDPTGDPDVDAILRGLHIKFSEDLEPQLEEELSAVHSGAAGIALSQIGRADLVDQVADRSLHWAEDYAAELVSGLEDTTRDMLRATIVDGIAENLSAEDISDRIEEAYAFSEERADLIAMTEIATANSYGALDGYLEAQEAGVSLKKSWLILDDACDICQENEDAGSIDLDEPFPSGDDAPPAHPSCRCVLVPEVEDEEGNITEDDSVDAPLDEE